MAAVEGKTYGEQRSALEVEVDAAVLARVKAGMALLEQKYGPDWAAKIDLDELDLSSPTECVLGQVYADKVSDDLHDDGYQLGVKLLGIGDDGGQEFGFTTHDDDDFEYGDFDDPSDDWETLTEAWKLALTGVV